MSDNIEDLISDVTFSEIPAPLYYAQMGALAGSSTNNDRITLIGAALQGLTSSITNPSELTTKDVESISSVAILIADETLK